MFGLGTIFSPVKGLQLIKGVIEKQLNIPAIDKYSILYKREPEGIAFIINGQTIDYPEGLKIAIAISDLIKTKLPSNAKIDIALVTYHEFFTNMTSAAFVDIGYELDGKKLQIKIDL